MTSAHGVSIDSWHLALLTPIVLAWFAWEFAGLRAARQGRDAVRMVLAAAVLVVIVAAAIDPLVGLAVLLWPVFVWRGAHGRGL